MRVKIIACKSNTPVSWIIRFITNSPYSHLGIKVSSTHMIDADWGGVKIRPLPKKFDEYAIENIYINDFKEGNVWLIKQIGKSYDFPGVISTAIYNGLGWKRKKNLFQDSDKYTCSELAFRYSEKLRNVLRSDVDSANFHPGMILESKVCRVK